MADFDPTVVTTEAEVAEYLRNPRARDAENVMDILKETDSVALKLESSWWGNEAFGVWSEWFFVRPDGVSPSGKALFVSEGVAMNDPVGKLRGAENVRSSRGGLTAGAARKMERKAYNWGDNSKKPGPGMPPTDDRDSFKGGSCPLSVVEAAFRLPEPENNAVFPADGDVREGKLSDGDIRVVGTKHTQYGAKLTLEGDTYAALSKKGDNVGSDTWDDHHTTFDGDEWVTDTSASGLKTLIGALNDAGYSVAVAEKFVRDDLSLNFKD